MEEPLAAADPPPGWYWNSREVAAFAEVDIAGNGPLTVRHGDSDGPDSRASAGGFPR